MHFLNEAPEQCNQLQQESTQYLAKAFEGVSSLGEKLSIKADENISQICRDRSCFFQKESSRQEAWEQYLEKQMNLYFLWAASAIQGGLEAKIEVQNYEAGATIIKEGTQGKGVFHLLEGAADVFVNDIKVGEVKEDEIFGALAALTSSSRSATVKARKNSIVIQVPDDEFLNLMKSRPATVLTLMRDMARAITSLNKKVVDLSELRG